MRSHVAAAFMHPDLRRDGGAHEVQSDFCFQSPGHRDIIHLYSQPTAHWNWMADATAPSSIGCPLLYGECSDVGAGDRGIFGIRTCPERLWDHQWPSDRSVP